MICDMENPGILMLGSEASNRPSIYTLLKGVYMYLVLVVAERATAIVPDHSFKAQNKYGTRDLAKITHGDGDEPSSVWEAASSDRRWRKICESCLKKMPHTTGVRNAPIVIDNLLLTNVMTLVH
jgi:hypothetical protein